MSKNEATFELIVNTLLSSQKVDPKVIRQHVQQYAQDNGLPYTLAKQAIVLVVRDRIQRKLEAL